MPCPYCGEDHFRLDCPKLKDAVKDVIKEKERRLIRHKTNLPPESGHKEEPV